jgi:hypothetical protein
VREQEREARVSSERPEESQMSVREKGRKG